MKQLLYLGVGILVGAVVTAYYCLSERLPTLKIYARPGVEVERVIISVEGVELSFADFGEFGERRVRLPVEGVTKYSISAKLRNGLTVSSEDRTAEPGQFIYERIEKEAIEYQLRASF